MRAEFPAKVKIEALARCRGLCEGEGCGAQLTVAKYAFDHILADGLGGKPTLDNCAVLCWVCHRKKTGQHDVPMIAKAERQRQRHLGVRPRKPQSKWKRKLSGETVLR